MYFSCTSATVDIFVKQNLSDWITWEKCGYNIWEKEVSMILVHLWKSMNQLNKLEAYLTAKLVSQTNKLEDADAYDEP